MRIRQFNCNDCSFQGENYSELKKHLARSLHTPSEQKEICYTCKKGFQSYFQLMNHRRAEHPSNKICRYFKKNSCWFDVDDCWYKHPNEEIMLNPTISAEFPCKECEQIFNEKKELNKHVKVKHARCVQKCRDYEIGSCKRSMKIVGLYMRS